MTAPLRALTSAIYETMAAHRGRAAVADDATALVVSRRVPIGIGHNVPQEAR